MSDATDLAKCPWCGANAEWTWTSIYGRSFGRWECGTYKDAEVPKRHVQCELRELHGENVLLRTQVSELRQIVKDQNGELQRLSRFVGDLGTTCWSCETCGHARNSLGCVWCDRDVARDEIARLNVALAAAKWNPKVTLA